MTEIHNSWAPLFAQLSIPNLDTLYNDIVYPPKDQVFRVFEMDVTMIRIVLLGQDPYIREGQAHGYSFSVTQNQKIPPSLRNIFKELSQTFPERNYSFAAGNLEAWAHREHIFLLNTALTVVEGKSGSHMSIWSTFTDRVIQYIREKNDRCVFLLLGNPAKKRAKLLPIDTKIVCGIHPSPLARGFLGSGVFRQVEEVLGEPVDWSL